MINPRDFDNRHLPNKQNSSSNYKQYPQGMTDKLLGLEHLWIVLPTYVKVTLIELLH